MSKRGDITFIKDIDEAINRIEIYTQDINYSDFLKDYKTQDAVLRNLEIIGEAAKNVSNKFKEKNPQILWKELAGLRDKLIHHYFGVNLDIVWTIIKEELPELNISMLINNSVELEEK